MTTALTLPGNIPIFGFSLLVGLGAALGMGWSVQRGGGLAAGAGFWVLFCTVLGGRAAYVVVHWEYFAARPLEIVQTPLGGLSWPGALAGAGLALLLAALLVPDGPWAADAVMPLFAMVSAAAWLACIPAGCAYGETTTGAWLPPVLDEWGIASPRVPLQTLGALGSVGLLALVDGLLPRLKRPGADAALLFFCLCLLTTVLSAWRADPGPMLQGLRLDTWAGLMLAVPALLIVLLVFILPPARPSSGDTLP